MTLKIKSTDIVKIEKTDEGYFLLEDVRESWFFSYDHGDAPGQWYGKWYGPWASRFDARVEMLHGASLHNHRIITEVRS